MNHYQRAAYTNQRHWPELSFRVRELRQRATPVEERLWQALRGKRLGVKFRRQHPIHRYIVDFYSVEAGLVIELDGPIHDSQIEADADRQAFLEANNIRVLRFTNDEVTNSLAGVIEAISKSLQHNSPS